MESSTLYYVMPEGAEYVSAWGGTSERRKGEGRGIEGNKDREGKNRHGWIIVYKDTHS